MQKKRYDCYDGDVVVVVAAGRRNDLNMQINIFHTRFYNIYIIGGLALVMALLPSHAHNTTHIQTVAIMLKQNYIE